MYEGTFLKHEKREVLRSQRSRDVQGGMDDARRMSIGVTTLRGADTHRAREIAARLLRLGLLYCCIDSAKLHLKDMPPDVSI